MKVLTDQTAIKAQLMYLRTLNTGIRLMSLPVFRRVVMKTVGLGDDYASEWFPQFQKKPLEYICLRCDAPEASELIRAALKLGMKAARRAAR